MSKKMIVAKKAKMKVLAKAAAKTKKTKTKKKKVIQKKIQKPLFKKFKANPILEPDQKHPWETKATFNAAAIYEEGRVHFLYRAVGDSDVSVLGYASSKNGFHIDERLDEPAYYPRMPFEGATMARPKGAIYSNYISGGGGCGGCEDPRLTKIGDRIYMAYVAYSGWEGPRIALSSIHIKDFLGKRWRWEEPVLISPPGLIDKNACILPEKIKGKYVIFHRVFPDILIDFVDDLNFDGKTKWLKGEFKISPRPDFWDSRKVGAGAPPIKTKYGWLLIYQAVGNQDPSRYKIGAMMLDLKNPAKVLARSKNPVLEPQEYYENEGWKFGIVYPCGAVVIEDNLIVYYGGADKVVCAASVKLDEFLEDLMRDKEPKLKPLKKLKK